MGNGVVSIPCWLAGDPWCCVAGAYDDLQVDNHISIHVSLRPMISIAHDFVPNLALAHLVAERPPLLRTKGVLAFVRVQLQDRIEDGQIQTPHLYPGGSRRLGDRCRVERSGAGSDITGSGGFGGRRCN